MIKKLRVTVDGKSYDVLVEALDEPTATAPATAPAPVQAAAAAAAAPAAAAPAAKANVSAGGVVSPLAAVVVSVDAKVGQKVAVGDKLLTLEAMKMNTFVQSPAEGTVAAILVGVGDSVEEGQELVTLS